MYEDDNSFKVSELLSLNLIFILVIPPPELLSVSETTPGIISCLDTEKILIIKGPRQVGKTTLMKGIIKRLSDKDKTTFYISADEDLDNSVFNPPSILLPVLKPK